jgi:hypothetical protein
MTREVQLRVNGGKAGNSQLQLNGCEMSVAKMVGISSLRPDFPQDSYGTGGCLYPEARRGKSGRSELTTKVLATDISQPFSFQLQSRTRSLQPSKEGSRWPE